MYKAERILTTLKIYCKVYLFTRLEIIQLEKKKYLKKFSMCIINLHMLNSLKQYKFVISISLC
jgi:hypothetical protein